MLRPGTYNADGTVTNASYRPVTMFSPIDGHAITMYDTVSAAAAAGRQERRHQRHEAEAALQRVRVQLQCAAAARRAAVWRLGDRSHRSPTPAARRRRTRIFSTTAIRSQSGIPWRTQFKLVGTYPLPWGRAGERRVPGAARLSARNASIDAGRKRRAESRRGERLGLGVGSRADDELCRVSWQLGLVGLRRGCARGPWNELSDAQRATRGPGTEMTSRITQLDLGVSKRISLSRIETGTQTRRLQRAQLE